MPRMAKSQHSAGAAVVAGRKSFGSVSLSHRPAAQQRTHQQFRHPRFEDDLDDGETWITLGGAATLWLSRVSDVGEAD